ncbi:kinase-like domain-containing protein [Rhodotorula diobovata]|uniref:[RNA-polymerase]-subunit kinase n=1 Tax=Rhodotorula diobovata TaxID=5288 RepID=A0A5C5G5T6_9BASI|nr:kinase-like domain-containing protein [Rhodotorula diobovata]
MEAAEQANAAIAQSYSKDKKVGEGTYAVVYLGKQLATNRKIAIKKIKVGQFKDGLDMSAIREVKFLRELRHPNVIELLDVFSNKTNLNLVLEFLDTDLEAVIRDKALLFQGADIKSWMLMTIKGLDFCHQNWILHRDMKPNNLLISADGVLKLADFGLAREYADEAAKMTCQVVTRWYRCPELLLGARSYSTGVDMWATGCIFAELMLRVPFMAAESDMEQLNMIFTALGTPTDQDWPVGGAPSSLSRSASSRELAHTASSRGSHLQGFSKLSNGAKFDPKPRSDLGSLFSAASPEAIDLLQKTLLYDPRKRITAREALHHPYFHTSPRPTPTRLLPKPCAELAPRALPPEEIGPPPPPGRGTKRSGEGYDEVPGAKKVARRLDFGQGA